MLLVFLAAVPVFLYSCIPVVSVPVPIGVSQEPLTDCRQDCTVLAGAVMRTVSTHAQPTDIHYSRRLPIEWAGGLVVAPGVLAVDYHAFRHQTRKHTTRQKVRSL
jgi:hypothetical protein